MKAVVLAVLATTAFAAQAEPDQVKASFDRMLNRSAAAKPAPSRQDVAADPLRKAIVEVLWRSQPPFHGSAVALATHSK